VAEALGFPGPDIDAELLLMCARLWDDLNLAGVRLQINCLGSAAERAAYRKSLVSYLESREKDLDDDSRRRLRTNPLRVLDSKNPEMQALIAGAPRMLDTLGEDSLKHFEGVQLILKDAGRPYEINPRLVRGLDYYNLTVFEWVSGDLGAQGTVCAGGRYDGLLEQVGGKAAPACGFAMGIERLLALLADSGERASPDVYLVNQGERAERFAFRVAEALREAGFSVVQHCGSGSFKSQMKKADASGAAVAVIVGDEEARAGEASVKALREEREQFRATLEGLPNAVADLLFGEGDEKGNQ
jgi:histidyl-tRNA synthetase